MDRKTVHVVFKTHLDIGFTDYAANVIRLYLDEYIPNAISLAKKMREGNADGTFVWTVGAWLIYEYLEKADAPRRRAMEEAILRGDINWHALPFTTHSELMDRDLFRFGLSLSQQLDRRFGKKTLAAKFTDVPGHCRGIISPLAEAGVTFLHLGINRAMRPVDVPSFFRWRSPDGREVIVNYATSYGKVSSVPGSDSILYFAHALDNCSLPSAQEITELFQRLRKEYPDCVIRTSTLNDYAATLEPYRESLPVVTGEMGDTWIHGTGSDPKKTAWFRELCRLRQAWKQQFGDQLDEFSRRLLLVPEHTWGMDEKCYLHDHRNYRRADFDRARKLDVVQPEVTYADIEHLHLSAQRKTLIASPASYRTFASSWEEQRNYIREAIDLLPCQALKDEAKTALHGLEPDRIEVSGTPQSQFETAIYAVELDVERGGIVSLLDKRTGCQWCHPGGALGRFVYEVFSSEDFAEFYENYSVNKEATSFFAKPDLTKVGLEKLKDLHYQKLFAPIRACQLVVGEETEELLILQRPDDRYVQEYGIPGEIITRIIFPRQGGTVTMDLQWSQKHASRIPEASWLAFQVNGWLMDSFQMDKMGEWIAPEEVLSGGNRTLHGIQSGVNWQGRDCRLSLRSLDAHLVSVGMPRILKADDSRPDWRPGIFVNLHNNLWGTNFPMWYEDDTKFRFELDFSETI